MHIRIGVRLGIFIIHLSLYLSRKTPSEQTVSLQISKAPTIEADVERGLQTFIDSAFKAKMPRLIPFVYSNKAVLRLAKQLKRSNCSGMTLYQYVFGISRFSRWIRKTPDQLVDECFGPEG